MLSEERKKRNAETLGSALKSRRIAMGFTQKALGEAIGLEYQTMVSQMELGYITIPASLWVPLANALRMDRFEWTLRCFSEINPDVYDAIFGNRSRSQVSEILTKMYKGEFDASGN